MQEYRVHDYAIYKHGDLISAFASIGAPTSFQYTGKKDDSGCYIMEPLPMGEWEITQDHCNHGYVLKIKGAEQQALAQLETIRK